MIVLVVNCGSSSLKYQLINMDDQSVMASGVAERIGIDNGILTHKVNGEKIVINQDMSTHKDAVDMVLNFLVDPKYAVLKSMDEINAVGHRVLHGGSKYSESVLINQDVLDAIEECIPLGPLHNPANLIGINACTEALPGVPQVAVFDTAFHQTMPDYAYTYPIPYEYVEKHKIRKYGFHGTSHRYVSMKAAEMMGTSEMKLITCHLGNGSSIAAVLNGKCVETSMGLTPLDGLEMGDQEAELSTLRLLSSSATKKASPLTKWTQSSTKNPAFSAFRAYPATSETLKQLLRKATSEQSWLSTYSITEYAPPSAHMLQRWTELMQ